MSLRRELLVKIGDLVVQRAVQLGGFVELRLGGFVVQPAACWARLMR
jgi:hypothetical protein